MKESTETKFERCIKEDPERWIGYRTKDGKLFQVEDADSGVTWIKTKGEWIWIV